MKGIYVVGADTGVGKTVVCAALVATLRSRGLDAGYMKPVGSDGEEFEGRLVSPDALFVARVTGLTDPMDLINPVCLPGALSPLAAAEASGRVVDLAPIEPAWRKLAAAHALTVVEGVGGVLVPIAPDRLFVDLMLERPLPVLVVGRPGLGTINHILLTIEALERRGVGVLGFCYSQPNGAEPDPSRSTNARHTRLFTDKPFFGVLPPVPIVETPSSSALARAGENLRELLDLLTD